MRQTAAPLAGPALAVQCACVHGWLGRSRCLDRFGSPDEETPDEPSQRLRWQDRVIGLELSVTERRGDDSRTPVTLRARWHL